MAQDTIRYEKPDQKTIKNPIQKTHVENPWKKIFRYRIPTHRVWGNPISTTTGHEFYGDVL